MMTLAKIALHCWRSKLHPTEARLELIGTIKGCPDPAADLAREPHALLSFVKVAPWSRIPRAGDGALATRA